MRDSVLAGWADLLELRELGDVDQAVREGPEDMQSS